MKRVNLLPPDMTHNLIRVRRRRILVGMLGIGMIIIPAWAGLALAQYQDFQDKILLAERQLTLRQTDGYSASILDAEGTRLLEYVATAQQLEDRVPPASALALMTHLAPESIRFDDLLITRIPTVQHKRTINMRGDQIERCAHIQLRGTAETNSALVEFIRTLSDNPFLQDVQAQQSREARNVGESITGFSITMDIISLSPEYTKAETP